MNPQDKQREEGKTYSYDGVSRRRVWRLKFFGFVLELYGREGKINEHQK